MIAMFWWTQPLGHYIAFLLVPTEIEARGERAQFVYQRALRNGAVNVYRARVLLLGQDRAGKTSLKNCLIGLPFNPHEQSTEGIEVDLSIFQVGVNEGKNWQATDESKQGFLGCSKDVAQMVVEKLCIPASHDWVEEEEERKEKRELENDDYRKEKQHGDSDGKKDSHDLFVNQVCKSTFNSHPHILLIILISHLTNFMKQVITLWCISTCNTVNTRDQKLKIINCLLPAEK